MLFANSTAILTDAFPADRRGIALGINQVAAHRRVVHRPDRSAACWPRVDWRRCSWSQRARSACSARSGRTAACGRPAPARHGADRLAGATSPFAVGLTALLAAITYGIQPYGGHTMGWTNPWVLAGLIGGAGCWSSFCVVETRVDEPMFDMSAVPDQGRSRRATSPGLLALDRAAAGCSSCSSSGCRASGCRCTATTSRGTPLWAGIYLLPLTVGVPRRRAAVRATFRPVRRAGLRHRRAADRRGELRRAAAAPDRLQLLGVRRPAGAERHRLGTVLRAEHDGDHEQRAGQQRGAASGMRGTFFNAGHVAVHRRLLLADDRRAGRHRCRAR